VSGPQPGLALNDYYVGDGEIVYRQACKRRPLQAMDQGTRITKRSSAWKLVSRCAS
jgi:hypothetical protein